MSTGFVLAMFFTIGWISLYVVRPESMGDALPQYRAGEQIAVVAAGIVMSLQVALSCTSLILTPTIPPIAAVSSALVFTAGIGFWLWARRLIGPLLRRRLPAEAPLGLRRHGAFGIVRNPLYLGALTAAGAPLVAIPRLWLGAVFILCLLTLATRATQDEARLHRQLGKTYSDYCRDVPYRLIPWLW